MAGDVTTDARAPALEPQPDEDSSTPERWVRHRADLARFAFAGVLASVVGLLTVLDAGAARRFSAAVIDAVDLLPGGVASALVGLTQLLAVVVPVVVVISLAAGRRWRVIGVLALGATVAAVVMALANGWLEDSVPAETVQRQNVDSWFTGSAFPSSAFLCAAVAVVVAGSPWMPRSWRPWAWFGVVALGVTRLVTAVEVPVHLFEVVVLGAAAGSLALVVTGAPRRPIDAARLRAALATGGLEVGELVRLARTTDMPLFRASTVDDDVLVKAIGRDERDAALLLRVWRLLTVRGLGDDVPAPSARALAEREALVLAIAANGRVRCPRPRALGSTRDGLIVLATEWVEGAPLSSLDPDRVDDSVLHDLWEQVAMLRRHRVAHRSLAAEHVLVGEAGVTVVGFDRADIRAEDHALAADVAEALCAVAVVVGAERAVASAATVLTRDALASALPLVQPVVLSPLTREAVKGRDDLLDDVRARAQTAAGVEELELARVQRVSLKGVVTLVGSAVLGYYLLTLVANWQEIWDTLQQANWSQLPWLLVLMVFTYVGGALSLMGAVRTDLPFVRTLQVMFAQSFLNRFTPANAGGMALRARYLQLQGEDLTVAAAAVGLTSAASGVVQGLFLVLFLVWAGSTDELSHVKLPGVGVVLLVVVAVGALLGFLVLSSWGRRVVVPWVRSTLGKVGSSLRELARMPRKVVLLFGGATLAKLAIVTAFYVSVVALGESMSFAQAASLYMIGTTIGGAVPTPGGVGGVEAVLTALLLGVGVPDPTAVSIVLLFRLVTFWLPTLPGWFFLQYVQRRGIV